MKLVIAIIKPFKLQEVREALIEAGSDKVFNFFTEAGTGFAEESLALITHKAK